MYIVAIFAVFVLGCRSCTGQEYQTTGRTTVTVPIGTIFPKDVHDSESLFKFILREYNSRALTSEDVWSFNSPALRFQGFLQSVQTNNSYAVVKKFCSHITQGVFVIFGKFDQTTSNLVTSYTNSFEMPWLSTSLPQTTNSRYILSLVPPISRAVLALISRWNCRHITYFYNHEEIHLSLRQILEFSLDYKFRLQVHNIRGKRNILPLLRQIGTTKEHVIILDVNRNMSLGVLQQLESIGMLSPEYQFIFTDLGLAGENLARYSSGGANITMFSITNKKSREYINFLARYKRALSIQTVSYEGAVMCDTFRLLYLGMKALLNQGYPLKNIVRQEATRKKDLQVRCHEPPDNAFQYGSNISDALKNVKFSGATGQVQFDKFGKRINYSVEILSLERTGVQPVGLWKDDQSVSELGSLYFNRTLDHNKIWRKYINETLIVTTILEEPYVTLKKDWKSFEGNERYDGFCVDLLKEIRKIAPIKYLFRPVKDGQYGSKDEKTGLWNGMIGEVKYNKAHMAVAPLTITSAREAAVEFTNPFMSLGISIMIKKPEKERPHIFSFLEPLASDIWISIVFAYIGVSVAIFIISRFSPYEWHREAVFKSENEEMIEKSADFGIGNSFWFSLGAIMQQGADISPKSFSGRLVGGIWWFFTLIIVSSYTANLAAFLTVERMGSTIKGVEDLASQSEIKYGTLKSGSTSSFFKTTPIALYEKMWNYMKNQEPSVFMSNNKEGIERVRSSNGKYAFLMESTLNDYTAQRKPCNTMNVGSNLDSKGYGIALPKGSPIYDSINLALLTLQERGILQKLQKFWWYDKSQCTDISGSKSDKTAELGLAHVAGVFYVLLGGLVIAILIALLEYTYKFAKCSKGTN